MMESCRKLSKLPSYPLKVASPVKGVFWLKMINKTNFEHGATLGVNN